MPFGLMVLLGDSFKVTDHRRLEKVSNAFRLNGSVGGPTPTRTTHDRHGQSQMPFGLMVLWGLRNILTNTLLKTDQSQMPFGLMVLWGKSLSTHAL